jgi:uncharacterized UPF0146 family protein
MGPVQTQPRCGVRHLLPESVFGKFMKCRIIAIGVGFDMTIAEREYRAGIELVVYARAEYKLLTIITLVGTSLLRLEVDSPFRTLYRMIPDIVEP